MRFLFPILLAIPLFASAQSEFQSRQAAHNEADMAAMRAGSQAFGDSINQRLAVALSSRFHTEFTSSRGDFRSGDVLCGVVHPSMIGGVSVDCYDSQNRPVRGLSQRDMLRALGCVDFYANYVSGDVSSKCGHR